MNRRVIDYLVVMVGLAAWPPGSGAQERAPIAIVVNPSTQISDISFARLRKIFLGEEQFWDGKQRITLLVRAPVAREREIVLKRIYDMSESQFRQYWIAKLFRAEVAAGPKIVYSTDMAKQLVIALPGAVAFLPAAEVGTNVKVLRIDGKLPGEPGYKLQ